MQGEGEGEKEKEKEKEEKVEEKSGGFFVLEGEGRGG